MSGYIEIRNLSKKIKGQAVLSNIHLQLDRGKIYGFQGRNGSGKTMLFRAICGLILPTEGEISVGGQKMGEDVSFPPSLGVLIEQPGFLGGYTGFRNLQLLASIKGKIDDQAIREAIRRVGLDPEDRRKYRKYSLGMKQRLGIAQAIMEDPDLIVLDEPTNAIDEDGVHLVKELLFELRDKGKTILIASHLKEELDLLVDEKFIMSNGTIAEGSAEK